jgi:hypothetical protein
MTRRIVLRLVAALAASWPLSSLKVFAHVAASPQNGQATTLAAVAEVVLPSSLTADERRAAVTAFFNWIAGYREGAEMGHGYGSTRLRNTGPLPATAYPAQLEALESAARARGATSLGALSPADRRVVIEDALTTPSRVTQLPDRPNGTHVVADFMGMFFNSSEGYNLAYRAAIDREDCRGLDGSESAPGPWPIRQGGR